MSTPKKTTEEIVVAPNGIHQSVEEGVLSATRFSERRLPILIEYDGVLYQETHLSDAQHDVVRAVDLLIKEGISPSIEEISVVTGNKSTHATAKKLQVLFDAGVLSRRTTETGATARTLKITMPMRALCRRRRHANGVSYHSYPLKRWAERAQQDDYDG